MLINRGCSLIRVGCSSIMRRFGARYTSVCETVGHGKRAFNSQHIMYMYRHCSTCYILLLPSLTSHFFCSLSFLQLLILVNGKDSFTYEVPLPAALKAVPRTQYYIAGGAVSTHTTDRHLQLVNAENSQVTWRLGSLQVLRGTCWEFMMHSLNCNCHLCMYLMYIIEEGREE